MIEILQIVIPALIGMTIGGYIVFKASPEVGTLVIDNSDGEQMIFLEVGPGKLSTLMSYDYVTLKVEKRNYISLK